MEHPVLSQGFSESVQGINIGLRISLVLVSKLPRTTIVFLVKDHAVDGRKLSTVHTVSREAGYGAKVLHQLCYQVVYEMEVKSAPNCLNYKLV